MHHPWPDKHDILHDLAITLKFPLGEIDAVKHFILNPCQRSYPIIYQSFEMEIQAGPSWFYTLLHNCYLAHKFNSAIRKAVE